MAQGAFSKSNHAKVWLSKILQGGRPRYFAAQTGGEVSADVSKEFDGGSLIPFSTASASQIGNITITLKYNPQVDAVFLKKLRKQVGTYRDTLTVLDTDANLNAIAGVEPRVYPDALLVRVGNPDYDVDGKDTRTVELEFSCDSEA